MGRVAALMAAFILYGSLYPFRLRWVAPGPALDAALATGLGGRGDVIANLALYAPLGFALAALGRRWWVAMPAAVLACAGLSALMELGQMFVPGRVASLGDLELNSLGGAAGALAGAVLGRRLGLALRLVDGGAAAVVVGWLGYRLHPFVPALDRSEWAASVAPLAGPWWAEPGRVLRLAGAWLVAARLLSAAGVPERWIAVAMLGTVAAGVPIVDRVLTPAEVLAVAVALPSWWLLRARRRTDHVLLAAMLCVVMAEGLAPYRLLAEARPFGWVPFAAIVGGQYSSGLQAVLLKLFLYGGLLWLALRAGLPPGWAGVLVVGLALAIGLAQTRLPGRSAETGDAVLALAVAVALRPGRVARDGRR